MAESDNILTKLTARFLSLPSTHLWRGGLGRGGSQQRRLPPWVRSLDGGSVKVRPFNNALW